MRKITSLLMLFCMFVGTALAQVTVGSVYSIQNKNSKKAISQDANLELAVVTANTEDNAQLWIVTEGSTEGTYNLRNLASGACAQYVNALYTHWFTDYVATDFYIGQLSAAEAETPAYYYISFAEIADATVASNNVMHESNGYVVKWEQTNDNSQWAFVEVEDIDVTAISEGWKDVTNIKASANAKIEGLAQISELFTEEMTSSALTSLAAVKATGTEVADLKTAADNIDAIVANVIATANNKNVKLCNKSEDGRGGNYLGYDKANNRAAAVADGGDAAIWTIKVNADGTFKLYNWVNNHYLGTPDDPTPVVADEANAPSFTFIPTAENEVALTTGGKMVHIANHSNYKVINYWSTSDKASLWGVTAVPEIVVTHEVYDAAAASAQVLSSAIYQAYGDLGLVNDTTQLSSNAKEAKEGSFKGLVDGDYATFFHSSWSAAIGDYHYLQVAVEEGIEDFFFYFKKRQQNNNNRPTEIDILGSVDGTEFSLIKTVSGCMPTDANCTDYVSQLVDGTAPVKHLRFVVKATSNGALDGTEGHPFFTFSEFDILPANDDIKTLVDAYHNFAASSITSDAMAAAATALVNAETTLSLANIKKEVAAILAANASKHAETPALGQYPSATYNALNAAYTAADATQESIEAAIAAFNNSKNRPVFTISSPKDYVVGKSIYDNNSGTLYFKATNIYDKSMWWAFDQTETTVGVTEKVVVTNVATGNKFWGANSVKITETTEADETDGIFLLYTEGNSTPVHYQNANQVIVRWNSTDAASGSAMTFTYVANTYDLEKLTDEHIAALTELKTVATANAKYLTAEVGTALGQYADGDKEAFLNAFAAARTIEAMSILEVIAVSPADILDKAAQITNSAATFVGLNMPTTGFYRVKSMNGNDENKKGKYWQSNAAGTGMELAAEKNDVRSVIYLDPSNNVISYGSGFALNSYSDFNDIEPKAWTIAENAKVAGAYALFRNGDTFCLSDWTGGVTYGQNDANAAWALEEVTALPVAISDSLGYATLCAPVALTIPAEVTAYVGHVEGDVLKLTAIEGGVIPAETAVLLQAAAGTYNFEITELGEALEVENDLIGISVGEASVEGVFTLQNINGVVGFHKYTAENLHGFKAFLIPETAQTVKLGFAGTTAIENITTVLDVNAPIYDLAGRRVNAATKGIFIQNGKKIIVK